LNGEQPMGAVFGELPYRDAVNAAAACIDEHFVPSQAKGPLMPHFVYEAEPLGCLLSSCEERQHRLRPHAAFHALAKPRRLFRLFIP
jgi:hypothetical protein